MRGLAGGAGFSVVAAFLAVASFRQVGGGAEPEKDVVAAVSTEEPGGQRTDPGNGNAGEATVPSPEPCAGGEQLLRDFRDLYGSHHRFRHLIVLAPDPAEAGGAEPFDLVLEGVEEAVSDDKGDGRAYVHDHQWLPWTDPAARALQCWKEQPGVSVFRPLDGPDQQAPLMVLFVGETPIWGLRAAQFNAAIDLIRRYGVRDIVSGPDASPVLVLGPTYSGTAASLSATIRQPSNAGRGFHIVSGTATTVKVRQILAPPQASAAAENGAGGTNVDPCAAPPRSGLVWYESATATDTCLLEWMEAFLVARGGKCNGHGDGNIALFTETSTTYGSVGSELESGGKETGESCFRPWKLPPDLASIRESSEKPDDKNGKGAGAFKEASLETAQSPEGAPRRLSPRSVARHALALGSTLDRLSNSKIRFAGIVATDSRDVLFLARRFRDQLPDIRLFTVGARIQYQDERAADALNGMLVVHSAPRNRNRSMALQNEVVRKIYHAGRRLLADEPLAPEVHVSFIGNGRLWTIDDFGESPGGDRGEGRVRRTTVPAGWQFTFALFCVLFLTAVVIVGLGARRVCWRPRGRLWALVAPCAHTDLKRQDFAVGAALIIVCAGPLVLMLESMIGRQGREPDHWGVCAAAAFLTVILSWFFHITWNRTTTIGEPPAGRWRRWLAFLPIAAPTVVLTLALYAGCGPERRATLYLLSGGSPVLVGLIAMGSYALALLCARMRLRMLDTHRFRAVEGGRFGRITPPIAQALGEKRGQKSGLADVEDRLLKTLYHPWKHSRVVPIAIHTLLFLTIAVPIWIKPPHTLEPGWRNVALVSLAIVTALTMSINLAWFLSSWTRFMRFLRRLACFPAIAALRDLPERRARSLEEQLAWSGSESTQLVYAVKILGRLADVDETLRAKYQQCRTLLETRLSTEATRRKSNGPELADVLLEISAEQAARRCEVSDEIRARIDDFAASLIDVFIPRYVRHFRLFVPPMVLGCLCSVFLASLYFVQPQRLIASIALFWVAVTVCAVLVSYVSLDVDPVLSAVAGSPSGKVSSRFALARKIAIWGAVPVASYLAVDNPQFPLWVSNVLDVVGKSLR